MIARITLAVPKTALAGVILEISFARFKASMAAFKAEVTPSRSSDRLDLHAMMVEMQGSCKKTARRPGCEEDSESNRDDERPFVITGLVQIDPFGVGVNKVQF